MKAFVKYGTTNRHKSLEIDSVLASIEDMKISEKDVVYNYDILHSSPWAPHYDFEQRHRKITEVS